MVFYWNTGQPCITSVTVILAAGLYGSTYWYFLIVSIITNSNYNDILLQFQSYLSCLHATCHYKATVPTSMGCSLHSAWKNFAIVLTWKTIQYSTMYARSCENECGQIMFNLQLLVLGVHLQLEQFLFSGSLASSFSVYGSYLSKYWQIKNFFNFPFGTAVPSGGMVLNYWSSKEKQHFISFPEVESSVSCKETFHDFFNPFPWLAVAYRSLLVVLRLSKLYSTVIR